MGLGLASEAVSGVLSAALGAWGFTRVSARTDADNRASRLLCERVGMTLASLSEHRWARRGRSNLHQIRRVVISVRDQDTIKPPQPQVPL